MIDPRPDEGLRYMAALRLLRPDVAERLEREALAHPHLDDYGELPLWSAAATDWNQTND